MRESQNEDTCYSLTWAFGTEGKRNLNLVVGLTVLTHTGPGLNL